MKRVIFVIFTALIASVVLIAGCSRDDIKVFDGRHQIYFDKFYMNALAPGTAEADTTRASFFFYPEGTQSVQVKLVVQLSGDIPISDLHFGLKAILEAGTAQAGDFTLADRYTFRARPLSEDAKEMKDTIEVTLNYSERLNAAGEEGLRLVVELVPGEQVDLGQYERRCAVIVWTNVEAQPEWWDYEVEWALLGKYTYKKYKLFLEVVDGAQELNEEMVKESPAKVIDLVNQFKKWLNEHLHDPDKGGEYQEILQSLP